jgi:hypothetical protein
MQSNGKSTVSGYYVIAPYFDASYGISGQDASFEYTRVVSAESDSFSVTGQDANPEYYRVFSAENGDFNVTGQDVTLELGYADLIPDSGSYAITGQDIDPLYNPSIIPDSDTYIISGQNVTFVRGNICLADPDSYLLTGYPIIFTGLNIINSTNYVLIHNNWTERRDVYQKNTHQLILQNDHIFLKEIHGGRIIRIVEELASVRYIESAGLPVEKPPDMEGLLEILSNFFITYWIEQSGSTGILNLGNLTDGTTVNLNCLNAEQAKAFWSTAQSTPTLNLSGLGKIVDVSVKKTISGDSVVTIQGTGYKFIDMDNKNLPAISVNLTLSDLADHFFEISLKDSGTDDGGSKVILIQYK